MGCALAVSTQLWFYRDSSGKDQIALKPFQPDMVTSGTHEELEAASAAGRDGTVSPAWRLSASQQAMQGSLQPGRMMGAPGCLHLRPSGYSVP